MQSKSPSPRDKYSGWIKDDRIYYFGGFGEPLDDFYLNECGEFHVDEQIGLNENVYLETLLNISQSRITFLNFRRN